MPLSVLETDRVFAERAPELQDLTVLDDLMIFIPCRRFVFPASEEHLLERLRAGFNQLEQKGDLLPLFERHFSSVPRILAGVT